MQKNEKGFSVVEITLVLLVVCLIGVVGFMVYKNHNKTNNATSTVQSNTSTQTKTNTEAAKPVLTDVSLKYSKLAFSYDPAVWKLNNNTSADEQPCGKSDNANLQNSGTAFQLNFELGECGKGGGSCADPDLHCQAESKSLATMNLSSTEKAYVVAVRTTRDNGQTWDYGFWLNSQPTCADSVICPMHIDNLDSDTSSIFGTYSSQTTQPKSLDDFASQPEIKAATELLKTLHYQ